MNRFDGNSNIDPARAEMVLRFGRKYWPRILAALSLGAFAHWRWPVTGEHWQPVDETQLALMLVSIFGAFGVWKGLQVIHVTAHTIEWRRLFFRRTLDRQTCRIAEYSSHGFELSDASGTRIHVDKLMVGARQLHDLIPNNRAVIASHIALAAGIGASNATRTVRRAKLIEPAILMFGLLAGGMLLVAKGIAALIGTAIRHQPTNPFDIVKLAIGAALLIFSARMIFRIIRTISRRG